MIRYRAILILASLMLAACGGSGEEAAEEEGVPVQGEIAATVSCQAQDSLLATIYMAGGDMAAASDWCSCGTGSCSIEFGSLGFGDYVLGIGRPDTLYLSSQGAEGFVNPIAYYRADSVATHPDDATVITVSEEQPSADVDLDLGGM